MPTKGQSPFENRQQANQHVVGHLDQGEDHERELDAYLQDSEQGKLQARGREQSSVVGHLASHAEEPDASATRQMTSGRQHASVHILVEMSFKQGNELLSIQHDHTKYEYYFDEVAAALTGTLVSPFNSDHTIDITVHRTETAANVAPAVWDHSGHGSIPANVAFIGGNNANGSRLGAFEVYLCTDFPDIDSVPSCSGLHSKLWSRHWPSVKRLEKRRNAILQNVFERWKDNEDLLAAMHDVAEADGKAAAKCASSSHGCIAHTNHPVRQMQGTLWKRTCKGRLLL